MGLKKRRVYRGFFLNSLDHDPRPHSRVKYLTPRKNPFPKTIHHLFGGLIMSRFMKEFREFAVKGNAIDLAVGVIIGAAFGKIVDSLVKDIFMPLASLCVGGLDFSNWFVVLGSLPADYHGEMTYDALTKAGVPLFAYGNFITIVINFIILALIIFLMIHALNRVRREKPAAPAAPPEEIALLRDIRDALKTRRSQPGKSGEERTKNPASHGRTARSKTT
jgi:large conductance mechanosensitive channel